MFWKKKVAAPPPTPSFTARTIPSEFYGGSNPEVTFKTVTKELPLVTDKAVSSYDKKMLDKATAVGSGAPLHPANLFTRPKFLMLLAGGVFVVAVGGISWYYWRDAQKPPDIVLTTLPLETPTESPSDTIEPDNQIVVSTTTESIDQPLSLSETTFVFPSELLGTSADNDNDTLTDIEEELFVTDPGAPDTDNDGYSDDLEIDNLYNPAGKAPVRLLDAGTVKEFTNPVFGYHVIYPTNWAGGELGSVDRNYRDVLFSTFTGENIQIKVFDKDSSDQQFIDWFGRYAVGERFENLESFESYYKVAGWKRKDNLVYYFPYGNRVYVIAYHTTNSTVVNFPTVIKLLARSMRFTPVEETEVNSTLPPLASSTLESAATTSTVNSTTIQGI